jgi:hypothetical protein
VEASGRLLLGACYSAGAKVVATVCAYIKALKQLGVPENAPVQE